MILPSAHQDGLSASSHSTEVSSAAIIVSVCNALTRFTLAAWSNKRVGVAVEIEILLNGPINDDSLLLI